MPMFCAEKHSAFKVNIGTNNDIDDLKELSRIKCQMI